MKLSGFKQSWSRAVRENTTKNFVIAALVATNAITAAGWFRVEETVVLVPAVLDQRMEVQATNASPAYKKAWALTVAQLAGNVTPGNADLVLESLGDLLSPDAYRRIAADLAAQVADIKRDSLTVSFEPRQILFESSTNKVFVSGQFASSGVSGQPIKAVRTYEMTIDMRFGRPWITSFKPYQGMPLTEESAKHKAASIKHQPKGDA
jgi:conjugal transfer pilus assembly protein TraE